MTAIDAKNLPVLAARAAAERPGVVGFIAPIEEGFRPVTYETWWGQIERIAAGIRDADAGAGAADAAVAEAGIRPRDRVLLMMETRYEWLLCDLAIQTNGALTVPVYPNLPASQLTYPLEDADPRVAIVARPEQLKRLLAAPGARERLKTIFLLDGDPPERCDHDVRSIRQLLARPAPTPAERDELRLLREEIEPDRPATILYTSGTSSNPKGVVLTHENILSNARMILATMPMGPSDRFLSILPLAHILERTTSYTAIAAGMPIAYGRGVESFARDAGELRPTVVVGVPRLFESIVMAMRDAARARGPLAQRLMRLAESGAIRRGRKGPAALRRSDGSLRPPRGADLLWDRLFFRPLRERLGGQLRIVVSGSAPLGRQVALLLCGAGIPIVEGYGLTEAGPVVSVQRFDAWRAGSVGPPLRGVEVRIGDDGEILVRSPSIMAGYLNLDRETREAVRGGWLQTGDLGNLDGDGILTITGRKKDMIVTSGGKNISPQKIEDLLQQSPLISQGIVFGDRRPYLVALIVADRRRIAEQIGGDPEDPRFRSVGRALVRREIEQVNHELAPHERIRAFDLLEEPPSIEAGTMTPTLKIRRRTLEARHAEAIAALYDRPRR